MNKMIVHGTLQYVAGGKSPCHCVAMIDNNGRYWNMRGGLEYMQREHDIMPCHSFRSLDKIHAMYNNWGEGWIYKPCKPYEI